jgi:hypothetical protein
VHATCELYAERAKLEMQLVVAPMAASAAVVLMVKIRQPSHEFTFGVGISFIPYPLVLTPVV